MEIISAAGHALTIVFEPARLGFMFIGVIFGLFLGVIPGLGGLLGLSLLLPFTFTMDPYTAVAIMLGLLAATSCSDSIPAVLLGVPGTVGGSATILDGPHMARRGEAGQALGASFFASMCGGVIGAICLALLIPVMRPLVLGVGTPELLAICVLGLSLIAILSSGMLLKGLGAAALGVLLSTVGMDANTGIMRWTFGNLYLWDGIDVVLVALGLFALPELADLFAGGSSQIAKNGPAKTTRFAQLEGARAVLRNKSLLLRSSGLGMLLASIPGIGATVIDWISYAIAKRTVRKDNKFGQGDIRGIIAGESANSAKDGGNLVPTVAFGVPGGPPMALILGAFLIHNITPGPEMLSTRLDVTYSLVWTIAVANVVGTAICFLFANQFAKLTQVRVGIIIPVIVAIVIIGAYQSTQEWGDFYALLGFGLLGWFMKRAGWPRPPLILGFVLGALIENYMFISFERYGTDWMFRPIVMVILAATFAGIAYGGWKTIATALKAPKGTGVVIGMPPARSLLTLGLMAAFGAALITTAGWPLRSQLVPQVICWVGLICTVLQLATDVVRPRSGAAAVAASADGDEDAPEIDGAFYKRSLIYAGWILFMLIAVVLVGLLPAIVLFLVGFMRFQGKESWRVVLPVAIVCALVMYGLFHGIIHVHWPRSLLGDAIPALRAASGGLV